MVIKRLPLNGTITNFINENVEESHIQVLTAQVLPEFSVHDKSRIAQTHCPFISYITFHDIIIKYLLPHKSSSSSSSLTNPTATRKPLLLSISCND
uniref:Uncharacterized protein n=1 Tax=Helianthus annuus TaxID=4232 RepID=A0A251VJA0_HELAN